MKESKFKLKNQPQIRRLNYIINDDMVNNEKNVELEVEIEGKSGINIENRLIRAEIAIKIFSENNEPFSIEGVLGADFNYDDTTTEEERDYFRDVLAPSILLSYFRPIISNLTTYSGFAPYIIPMLDLR